MTRWLWWLGWTVASLVWAGVGYAHKVANVRPGRLPSWESAVLVAVGGAVGWYLLGLLLHTAAERIRRRPADRGRFFAVWSVTQLPLGLEAVGAVLMLDPGWLQVLGYELGVIGLMLLCPAGVVIFLTRTVGMSRVVAFPAGLVGWYLWLTKVWVSLVR